MSLLIKQLDDNQLSCVLTRNKWPLRNTAGNSGNEGCATFLRHSMNFVTYKAPIHGVFCA